MSKNPLLLGIGHIHLKRFRQQIRDLDSNRPCALRDLILAIHQLILVWQVDLSRRKNSTFKLFLFDIGLLGCLADIPIRSVLSQDFGSYKGFLAENYVAQELQSSGAPELYSWKGKTSEIEFLVVINENIIPIEVKSGSRFHRAKSLAVYRGKYSPVYTVVVTAGPERISGNHYHLPLYKVSTVTSPMDSSG